MATVSGNNGLEGQGVPVVVLDGGSAVVPDAALLFTAVYTRIGGDLLLTGADGAQVLIQGYFAAEEPPILFSPTGAVMAPHVVAALVGDPTAWQVAQAGPLEGPQPIGQAQDIVGTAQVVRGGATIPLNPGDPVFQGDVVRTGLGSELAIGFADGTIFSLSANARMVLDGMVYDPAGSSNSLVLSIVHGTFSFVTGQIAPTGGMDVNTPVATIGIRGTTVHGILESIAGPLTVFLGTNQLGARAVAGLFNPLTGQSMGSISDLRAAYVISSPGADLLVRGQTPVEAQFIDQRATSVHNIQATFQFNFDLEQPILQPGDGDANPIQTEAGAAPDSGGIGIEQEFEDAVELEQITIDILGVIPGVISTTQPPARPVPRVGTVGGVDTNQAPNAVDDEATTDMGVPVTIAVLANDGDPDGDSLGVSAVTQGANGAVAINDDGTVTYTPDPDFSGTDSFTYTASDGLAGDTATVTVSVDTVNTPPAVALEVVLGSLAENTDTSTAIKVADILVGDDGTGVNNLALTGADADLFEIVGGELFLKAGAALDFETNPLLDVIVTVDDPSVGATPDDSAALALSITDVNEVPRVTGITIVNDETEGLGDTTPSDDTADPAPLPAEIMALGLMPINTSVKPIPFDYGADGPGGIALDPVVDGTGSKLFDTATGLEILLFNGPDGTIVGQVGSADGDIAFVSVLGDPEAPIGPDNTSSADLWFVQYRAIEHDDPLDADEAGPESGGSDGTAPSDVIDFESLAAGTILGEVMTAHGRVTVQGLNPDFAGLNAAVIFDSSAPTDADPDLGTPNKDFGGPGVGVGGASGSRFENDTALGNILIVGANLTDTTPADGLIDNPDDSSTGGTLGFGFGEIGSVLIESLTVIDVETSEKPTRVALFDDGDNLIASFIMPQPGDNGVATAILPPVHGVVRMEVVFGGSGAIDNVVFRPETDPIDEFLNLGYTVTDGDGDTASAAALITIEDDGPTAVGDPAVYVDAKGTVSGDLLADNGNGADALGVDGASPGGPVIAFTFTGEDTGLTAVTALAGATVTTAAGGELTVNADGTWVYDAPVALDPDTLDLLNLDPGVAGFVDDFSYLIRDGDGDVDSAAQSVRVVLDSSREQAGDDLANTLDGGEGGDFLRGGGGNDTLNGNGGADFLFGDAGDDGLDGGGGNDVLIGDAGDDTLRGGFGHDVLTGAAGADTFVLAAGEGGRTLAAADLITDFEDGVDAIGLAGGLSFADLGVANTGDGGAAISFGAELLAVLDGIDASLVTADDFVPIA